MFEQLEDIGDSLDKIRIWHDNEGLTPGWKLDKVEIRKLHDSGKVGMVTLFRYTCDS